MMGRWGESLSGHPTKSFELCGVSGHLSLHLRVTLWILVLVLAIFGLSFSLYLSVTRTLIVEENRRRAELLAAQLAQRLATEQTAGDLATLRNDALYYQRAHTEITEVHIYGVTRAGVREVIALTADDSTPVPLGTLSEARQGKVASVIEATHGGSHRIAAAAPIEGEGKLIGLVLVRAEMAYYRPLWERMRRSALLILLGVAGGIAAVLHIFFGRMISRPIGHILQALQRVQQGDLSVQIPIRSRDEIGTLAEGLNTLLARIRQMTEALAAEHERLESLARQATDEANERNRELQEATRQLFAMQRQLLQMERAAAAGHTAAQLAHEIGTPLNLISGHIQLLRARASDEDQARRLTIILGQIERIERIVRRTLDATRRPRPERLLLSIASLLHQVAEIVAPALEARRIALVLDVAPNLPPILGVPEHLHQALINLIDNSLDAMPEGGQLTLRASFGDAGTILIECTDTGVGMSADVRARAFDPFFTTKPEGLGSGLGLAIVRQIVAEHGGQITLESEPGRGTTIRLAFPAAPDPPPSLGEG